MRKKKSHIMEMPEAKRIFDATPHIRMALKTGNSKRARITSDTISVKKEAIEIELSVSHITEHSLINGNEYGKAKRSKYTFPVSQDMLIMHGKQRRRLWHKEIDSQKSQYENLKIGAKK